MKLPAKPLPATFLNYALAVITAFLLLLTHPQASITPLAAIALTPLLVALARERRRLHHFFLAYTAGVVYWFGVCYWIQAVLLDYGAMGWFGSWGSFLLFALGKALHFGGFGFLAGFVIARWWAVPAVAALWVAVEGAPQFFDFTWLLLGNAGIDMGLPMRLAPYTGVFGLSFVFALLSVGLAVAVLRRSRLEFLWLLPLGALYLLPPLPGAERADRLAIMVQPNISMTQHWTEASVQQFLGVLTGLSLRHAAQPELPRPDLLLWPEVPAPFYYEDDAVFRERVTQVARLSAAHTLVGTVAFTEDREPLNSAVLVSPQGNRIGRYDKVNLVPFGEYVPAIFSFVNRITQEAGDFRPGRNVVVFDAGAHKLGAFICYESVFPNFVRAFVANGAEVLVNLSNDGYFGRSAAREQHLKIVRMRAAENARWILRATNDGITVAIDPSGRIRQRIPAYEASSMNARFRYHTEQTFYTRHGNWFLLLCAGLAVLAIAANYLPAIWHWQHGS
jgi:apolipoprotein N-acyltransferase